MAHFMMHAGRGPDIMGWACDMGISELAMAYAMLLHINLCNCILLYFRFPICSQYYISLHRVQFRKVQVEASAMQ